MAPKDETPWRPCAADAAGPAVPQREFAARTIKRFILYSYAGKAAWCGECKKIDRDMEDIRGGEKYFNMYH